jgi:hypothetical protein
MRMFDDACGGIAGSLRDMPHPGLLLAQRPRICLVSPRLIHALLVSSRLRAGPPAARKNNYTIPNPVKFVNPKSSASVVVL